jgi:hypothetical protein
MTIPIVTYLPITKGFGLKTTTALAFTAAEAAATSREKVVAGNTTTNA